MTLVILNAAPFAFAWTLWKNRHKLKEPEVKLKIGALYELHDANRKYVGTYPVIFLLRRSFFVTITFTMVEHPSLQVHAFIVSALLYLCYITQ